MNRIDAKMLQKIFLAGAKSIEAKKEYINELNVFPVPDGDTGTNMTLTIMSAAKEVSQIENPTIENLSKAISGGSLRGARGNSGVILSQLLRGFTREIAEHDFIDVTIMSNAFQKAVETAYKAVMKPKEGTILTVAREGAEKAAQLVSQTDNLIYFCDEVLKHMEVSLSRTPDLLPVLKEAGVVDSGGQGLLEICKGAYDTLLGKEVNFEVPSKTNVLENVKKNTLEVDIKFGYCTEFIVMLEKKFGLKEEQEFKAYLESIGDSIVVVSDDEIVKVHVHTNDPGLAIQKGLTFGSLTNMKIDNMREEHRETLLNSNQSQESKKEETKEEKKVARKDVGFISVSIGEGLGEIFKGLGVDYLIEGGQTMNPSTEDMLNAIDQVNADTIFILPNNKNIILAAEQAKELTEDKNIVVIPSKTIPQGITAVINYVYDKSIKENSERMIEEMNRVKTGQVTYAVRDTTIDGKEIKLGNIMGIGDKGILSVGDQIDHTTLELMDHLIDDESELVSIYYGAELNEEDASAIADAVSEKYPDLDVEVHLGGQPIYYYLISVE